MREYNVFMNPFNQYEAVKVGFSWPGLFFCGIWLLVKKMWKYAGYTFGGFFLFAFILGLVDVDPVTIDGLINGASFGLAVYFGVAGNKLRERNLIERGYTMVDTVSAESADGAIASVLRY
jgi:hypothetical protein